MLLAFKNQFIIFLQGVKKMQYDNCVIDLMINFVSFIWSLYLQGNKAGVIWQVCDKFVKVIVTVLFTSSLLNKDWNYLFINNTANLPFRVSIEVSRHRCKHNTTCYTHMYSYSGWLKHILLQINLQM